MGKQTDAYKSNGSIPAAGSVYSYTKEELQEYLKCSKDPVYFIKTYMKIIHVDKGLVPFALYDYQERMIRSYSENRFNITLTSRQTGKALAVDTPIMTTDGWKQIQDIHPDDYVYTPEGKPTKVIAESPIFIDHETYEVEFDTGDKIIADADHLWRVEVKSGEYKTKILKTSDIAAMELSKEHIMARIPATKPLEYETKDLPIEPYALGLWLGDGYSASSRLIGCKDDIDFYETQLPNIKFVDNKLSHKHIRLVRLGDLHTILNTSLLLNNKHIPTNYIYSDVDQRLSLVQGMMDTDGSSTGTGSCEFYNKNLNIINSFREILYSLGIKNRLSSKLIKGQTYYTVRFSTELKVFRLPRKIVSHLKTLGHKKSTNWYIKKVTPLGKRPTKCISVEDPSHMFLCGKQLIPTHNSTTVIGFFLHYILFNVNVNACISANKQKIAVDLLGRLKLAYENVPRFLQQGVTKWAQTEVELENGSRIFAAATSSSSVRGGSYNILLLDEFAHVPENIAQEFYASTFPTISSGKTTKVIMISTPNGMNLFHRFWVEANAVPPRNDFKPLFVNWSDVPGRDDAWKAETIKNIGGPEIFDQEFACSFISSSYTLISPQCLNSLTYADPVLEESNGYKEFVPYQKDHIYTLTVDTATGQKKDSSAFTIIDVTEMPYRVVATYANNLVKTMEYPRVIMEYAKKYNYPYIMIEINDIGRDIANILFHEFSYPSLLSTRMGDKRQGQKLSFGNGMNRQLGVRMTTGVKKSGCALMKALVENGQLIVSDHRIIKELSTFVQNGRIYEAMPNQHDDHVMTLVVFAWLSLQPGFGEITSTRALSEYSKIIDAVNNDSEFMGQNSLEADEAPLPMVIPSSFDDDPNMWLLQQICR